MENICLEYCGLAVGQVACRNLRREAQINAHDMCSPARGHIGEAPHTASHI